MFLDAAELKRAPRNGKEIADFCAVGRIAGLKGAGAALRVAFENA